MLSTVLLIVVILLLVGAFPAWPYSRSWGYAPTGTLGVVLIVVIVLVLMGTICGLRAAQAPPAVVRMEPG
jgi:hypothetical protein